MAGLKKTPIGEIPEDWEVVELEEIAERFVGGGTPSTKKPEYWNGDIPWITSAIISGYYITDGEKYITEKGLNNSSTNIVPKGNIVVATRVGLGKAAITKIDVAINQDLTGVILKKELVDPEYLVRYVTSPFVVKFILSAARGTTIKGISRKELAKLKIPLPPLPEQKKIAEILRTVDEDIEKTDEAIERTERLKKGLMQRLLTKGIKHERFKKTELGEIPEEWRVVRLEEISNIYYGLSQPLPELESGVPMIRATNIRAGKVYREGLIKVDISELPANKRHVILQEGDIIVVRSGAYTGDIGIISREFEGSIAGYDLIVRLNHEKAYPEYTTYYLLSPHVQSYFTTLRTRSAQPHLNSKQLKNTKIPLPPLSEQKQIAEILSTVDRKLELLRKRREKLEKVKKGLMKDLLTGRRRVKHYGDQKI
ncbi:restriction endonuclease subunit S [Thermococcus indicus]|uniref:Restriction endonuclease subunit S n=1 Tax=Thermococcus indicus TaxID=2586643 RepID=A0A4Y5SMW2_9EURY|nr:restriction endonuclease subunit S [Thermococcus indicus]QDA31674.1 restriction endonuclease subunit S [Thermococcus indicus]